MPGFNMDDYVPVNERIEQFYKAYPEGSLQSEIVELTGSRVTFRALAFRTPDDGRPGIGHSSLEIPGSTPYTRGSEIENAETSAWGRAIAALGFEVKRGVASREEVRNKQPGQAPVAEAHPAPAQPTDEQLRHRYQWARQEGWPDDEAVDASAIESTGQAVMAMDNDTWRVFAAAVLRGGPRIEPAAGTVGQPEAASVPDAAPADSLGLIEDDAPDPDNDAAAYKEWFDALPRERRATLRSQGRAPKKVAA